MTQSKIKYRNFVVGIDLGTTFSCCHYWDEQGGKYVLLTRENGNQTLPSIVDFSKKPVMVGKLGDSRGFYVGEVKRLIGLSYDDPDIQKEIEENYFSYDIVGDETAYNFAKVSFKTQRFGEKTLYPEEVSAMVLMQFKEELKSKLKIDIDVPIKAIVTVPAFFSNESIERTKRAVKYAGFDLIRLVKEPVAAAYAYKDVSRRKGFLLVFDLKKETFDVSLLKKKKWTEKKRGGAGKNGGKANGVKTCYNTAVT